MRLLDPYLLPVPVADYTEVDEEEYGGDGEGEGEQQLPGGRRHEGGQLGTIVGQVVFITAIFPGTFKLIYRKLTFGFSKLKFSRPKEILA